MIAGLFVAINVDATAGLWLTLTGWFLGRASRLARSQDRLMRLTEGLDVGDALQRDMPVVSPFLTLDTLLDQDQLAGGPGVYPVHQGDGAAGRHRCPGHPLPCPRSNAPSCVSGTGCGRSRASGRCGMTRSSGTPWPLLERGRARRTPRGRSGAIPAVLLGLVTRASVMRLLRTRAGRSRVHPGMTGT